MTETSSNDNTAREKRNQICPRNCGLGLAIYIVEGLLSLKVSHFPYEFGRRLTSFWNNFTDPKPACKKGLVDYGGNSWLSYLLGKESQFNLELSNHSRYRKRLVISGPLKKRIGN